MNYEDPPPGKDAAEVDARLRALPGGRRNWAASMVVLAVVVLATILLVVQGVASGEGRWFGLAVLSGATAAAMGGVVWVTRAARHSSEEGGPTRWQVTAWGVLLVAAAGAFVVGAVSASWLGIAAYVVAGLLAWGGYRVLRG